MKKKGILLTGLGLGAAYLAAGKAAEAEFERFFRVDPNLSEKDIADVFPSEEIANLYFAEVDKHVEWFRSIALENLEITSFDGLKLDAVLTKENAGHRYLLMAHGFRNDRYLLLKQAYEMSQRGYNILLIDQRGYGHSEGEYTTFGLKESLDIAQWISALIERDKEAEIGLYGVSMGASSILMALGTSLPENVRCVIADSAYSSLYEEAKFLFLKKAPAGYTLYAYYLDKVLKEKLGFCLGDVDCLRAVRNNRIPVLFIHSDSDKTVPYRQALDLFDANAGYKKFYPLKGCEHIYGCYQDEHYFDNLEQFMKNL